MKKKRAEQVLQTTVSLTYFELQMSTCIINRNEKKHAEQVLKTTVSLIWFKFQMPNCNINRNKKIVPSMLQTTVSLIWFTHLSLFVSMLHTLNLVAHPKPGCTP